MPHQTDDSMIRFLRHGPPASLRAQQLAEIEVMNDTAGRGGAKKKGLKGKKSGARDRTERFAEELGGY